MELQPYNPQEPGSLFFVPHAFGNKWHQYIKNKGITQCNGILWNDWRDFLKTDNCVNEQNMEDYLLKIYGEAL